MAEIRNPTGRTGAAAMSWLTRDVVASPPAVGELVFAREIPPDASIFDCLRAVWDEARLEAHRAYERWSANSGGDAYYIYRAAQDRADAAQDALADCAHPALRTDCAHPARRTHRLDR
jgi:hypothetical protein